LKQPISSHLGQLSGEAATTQLFDAINWLMGLCDDFERPDGARGQYWWRSVFASKAGLVYDFKHCRYFAPGSADNEVTNSNEKDSVPHQPQPAGVPQQAQAEVSAVTSQEPYAWTRRRFIEDDRGTPIGMDEPEFSWGAEPPEESGWFPLYAASPSAPAAQPAPQWISVDERMPEPGTEVIVWSPGNAQHGAFVFIDTWREQRECPVDFSTVSVPIGLGWDSSDFDEITHWMPLPAAPSPEGEKSNGE
jgi:hypothetical protein